MKLKKHGTTATSVIDEITKLTCRCRNCRSNLITVFSVSPMHKNV